MFTELHYLYRDAANYKEGRTVYFEGEPSMEQLLVINKTLDQKKYFIPDDVGLEELQERLSSFPSEDDHVWHEFTSLDVVAKLPADAIVEGPVNDLVEAFRKIGSPESWDVPGAMTRLGISG